MSIWKISLNFCGLLTLKILDNQTPITIEEFSKFEGHKNQYHRSIPDGSIESISEMHINSFQIDFCFN